MAEWRRGAAGSSSTASGSWNTASTSCAEGFETKPGEQQGEHRSDAVAADRRVVPQSAQQLHMAPVQPHLLLRLAQGRGLWARIGGVDAATRKTHLPGMGAQMRGALGQQDAGGRPGDDAHQHGGWHQIGVVRQFAVRRDRRGVQRIGAGQAGAQGLGRHRASGVTGPRASQGRAHGVVGAEIA